MHGKRGSGGALRAAGFSLLVLLAVTLAVLRGVDAWQKAPVIAELHRPPAFAVPRDFDFGRYRLSWLGSGFEVHPVAQPDRVLWRVEGGFLAAGIGRGEGGAWERRELLNEDRMAVQYATEAEWRVAKERAERDLRYGLPGRI